MTPSSATTLPTAADLTGHSDAPTVLVEIWSDIACPWCYIGKRRFAAALHAFAHRDQVEVVWRSYELSPETPTGPGLPEIAALSARMHAPEERIREMFAHVTAVAAGDGLVYDFDRAVAANTFDAHRLVHVAREHGGAALAERTLEALFAAQFTQGGDLGTPSVLAEIAAEAGFAAAGLDDDAVLAVLAGDDAADAVRHDEAEARALGVTGVPFFVAGRRIAVSGAQPVEVFGRLLEAAWQEANPLTTLAGADEAAGACVDDSCGI
ncbi:MAG TPA: DsbA family oxidoreductase [Cellulomonas sp.]|uniref:DsbA family oxidoreductase n=1 Tax=Cellulomonas sp. TaxID=40001 RepID=UPI002E2F2C8C|nr:DsbA family oxidoreductase [Cellulomonas sp.]HEX5332126.1 DsbA family oxidoreductase [Cellulomonas sp.]